MKNKFKVSWIASRQPRKQRKFRHNAPLHIRHKLVSANLNKELRKKYGRRSFSLRKGDSVKIMVGEFKKKTGKINEIDLKNLRVSIESIQKSKRDGTKRNIFFDASNLQIQELNLEDKNRIKAIEKINNQTKIGETKNVSKKK
jgi:large subunit ribosomal protein L24